MRSFSRLHVLLLSLLLSLAGLGRDAHALLVAPADTALEDSLSGELQIKRLADSFGLHQQSEQAVSPLQHLPAPASKLQSAGFGGWMAALEHRLHALGSAYLAQAAGIRPGLDRSTLIFPFHYFW
ncbi:hypothetical protein [Cesiribacter andamanensis]|uniref:Uncharacterized protein n=1 Tax=Cesiribacter andamanensis AMV16 TaxID=1279009 RepID=M7NB15_9BACT|nr:hypothetical protein [Cesiribacter andamanensis]EMR04381.1 hypothetical protein ADICEAN_00415 [Cesiribacter andamanensis AMV16]